MFNGSSGFCYAHCTQSEKKRQESDADMQALKQEILESLHCALPGTVVSFDSETQTAVIRPAVKHRLASFRAERSGAEGSPSSVSLPLLRDVPVFMPVPFDIHEGDACLVIFADRDIDAWYGTGEPSVPPSGRMHSLSDGFAFVGFGEPAPSPGGDSLGFYIDEYGYICQETEGDET